MPGVGRANHVLSICEAEHTEWSRTQQAAAPSAAQYDLKNLSGSAVDTTVHVQIVYEWGYTGHVADRRVRATVKCSSTCFSDVPPVAYPGAVLLLYS